MHVSNYVENVGGDGFEIWHGVGCVFWYFDGGCWWVIERKDGVYPIIRSKKTKNNFFSKNKARQNIKCFKPTFLKLFFTYWMI